jgi:hypothetical protein
MATRKRFDVMDQNGVTRYPLHGTSIRADGGLVELFDVNTKLPGEPAYVKSIVRLKDGDSIIEVAYVPQETTA